MANSGMFGEHRPGALIRGGCRFADTNLKAF
jgi:hypothetical protein